MSAETDLHNQLAGALQQHAKALAELEVALKEVRTFVFGAENQQ